MAKRFATLRAALPVEAQERAVARMRDFSQNVYRSTRRCNRSVVGIPMVIPQGGGA